MYREIFRSTEAVIQKHSSMRAINLLRNINSFHELRLFTISCTGTINHSLFGELSYCEKQPPDILFVRLENTHENVHQSRHYIYKNPRRFSITQSNREMPYVPARTALKERFIPVLPETEN